MPDGRISGIDEPKARCGGPPTEVTVPAGLHVRPKSHLIEHRASNGEVAGRGESVIGDVMLLQQVAAGIDELRDLRRSGDRYIDCPAA